MKIYSSNFEKLKLEIENIFSTAEFELEGAHSRDTWEWVMKIDKNSDEALQIAALAHDIDRGVKPKIMRLEGETYDDYKVRHAKRSAEIISKLMIKHGYDIETIRKTTRLVENHEVGGDRETDILMDADSVSFFSCNLEWYFNYKKKNYDETKREIIYKYERASLRARQMIRKIEITNKVLNDLCNEVFKLY